ncbi:MAG TPA: hypothetical protein DCG16_06515 [Gemmatimonadetes bacterium]|nr:hypothetical protein [Gemmatimonadota bacterium]
MALTLGLGLATFATESGFREVVHLEGLFRDGDGEGNTYVDTPPGEAPNTSPREEEVPSSSKDSRAARGCSHFGFLNSS